MKTEIVASGSDLHNIEFMKLDLSSFRSTKEFVISFKEKQLPLHILINNAALCSVPFGNLFCTIVLLQCLFYLSPLSTLRAAKTEDGFESQFQVNHLSHFLLTLELLPIILDTAESCNDCRIVLVSSIAHRTGVFDPQNMNGEVSYGRIQFYWNSKLYNVRNTCL